MVMKCRAVLLGVENKTSANGNSYVVGLFQQGVDTLRSMVKMKELPQNLEPYKQYDLELAQSTYNGQIRLDVTDMKKVSP